MSRTPRINVQYSVYFPTKVRKDMMMAAPKTGPAKVYHPPKRHMMNISRDKVQNNRSAKTERSNTTKRKKKYNTKKTTSHHKKNTASDSSKEGGNNNSTELIVPDIDAHGFTSLWIIPNRLKGAPKWRFYNHVH
jgi:hypothetical protein